MAEKNISAPPARGMNAHAQARVENVRSDFFGPFFLTRVATLETHDFGVFSVLRGARV